MGGPYTREDAKNRARYARNAAESYRQEWGYRMTYADEYTGADRVAALACVEVARRHIDFELACAAAYDRIARGEDPFAEPKPEPAPEPDPRQLALIGGAR